MALQNRRINLSLEQKQTVFEYLLERSENGKLKKGTYPLVSQQFSISIRTVHRIWKQGTDSHDLDEPINLLSRLCGRNGKVGRKKVQFNPEEVRDMELRRRSNIRSMAVGLGMSKSTLHRRIKEGELKAHTSAIKPHLSEEDKKNRLMFCLSFINPSTINTSPLFHDMFNFVHIDEKWFFMTKTSERYYLLPDEIEPIRTCKNKRFLTKVMFMAAVARPRFDDSGNVVFSGKIGIYPFVTKEPAKRKSKNRDAGTLETKPLSSITKESIRSVLIDKILPDVKAKWPSLASKTIYVQQDNAKPHIEADDEVWEQVAMADDFNFHLQFQPPNSPDLNVLDLGFFRAIQALQHQKAPKSIDELVDSVLKAYEDLSPECLNKVFLSLQLCMGEVLKHKGGNEYSIPHIGKSNLIRNGRLPVSLGCESSVVREALDVLSG